MTKKENYRTTTIARARWADWAPCLPEKAGSLNNESWSGVGDRIDGWWNQTFHRMILKAGPGRMSKSNTNSREIDLGIQRSTIVEHWIPR